MDCILPMWYGALVNRPQTAEGHYSGKMSKTGGCSIDAKNCKQCLQAAPGQIQTSWHRVRESVETRRPQGTHAMRSGPLEVNKRVHEQARGQASTAGSQLNRPRCGGQAQDPQEISEHHKGLGF